MFVLIVRPFQTASFHFARPALDAYAARVVATPFSDKPPPLGRIGIFFLTGIDRCPHGLAFEVIGAGELFYRTDPGECSRHTIGRRIDGNWYEIAE